MIDILEGGRAAAVFLLTAGVLLTIILIVAF